MTRVGRGMRFQTWVATVGATGACFLASPAGAQDVVPVDKGEGTSPAESQPKAPAAPTPSVAPPVAAAPSAPSASPRPPASPPAPASPPSSAAPPGGKAPVAPAPTGLTPPALMRDVVPIYPSQAKAEGVAGAVVLELDIDEAGKVSNATVVTATPAGQGFEAAALSASRQLEFTPAQENGVAIPVRIQYRFRFVPEVAPPPPPPSESPASAQEQAPSKAEKAVPRGDLWGALRERGTRLPLGGVTVTVFRGEGENATGFETETDAQGEFRFEGLEAGAWRLLADPDGYFPVRASENVDAGERTSVRYTIEKSSYNPYDVMVNAKRVQREVNKTSIDAKRAERVPGTFGDVLAVVQNLPGVARAPVASGAVIVRGSAPEDTQALLNGMELPLVYHFFGIRSVLPVGMVEQIDFYPGNFSVEYGRATGGIIDVGLKELKPQKIGGYADISLFDTSLYLEAPITDQLSIALAGRRSYIDTILSATTQANAGSLTAPRYYDAQALVSYKPSAAHQVEGFFLLSDDVFKIVFEEPAADDAESVISSAGLSTSFYRLMGEYKYVPNQQFSNELKFSFGRDQVGVNLGTALFIDYDQQRTQVRDTARYEMSDMFALRGGVDYLYEDVSGAGRLPALSGDDGPAEEPGIGGGVDTDLGGQYHSGAVFAELEYHPTAKTLVLPGVRAEYFSRTNEYALSPRLTLRHEFSEPWTIKGGVGLFVQEPELTETNETLGNPDLGLERAIHYSAGFEYRPLDYLTFDITGFYKTLDNLTSVTDRVQTGPDGLEPLLVDNGGTGSVIGLEISTRHEFANNFYGWLAYTLSRAERRDSGATVDRLFEYDQTHILTAVASYQLPRNWEISSRFRYVTGNVNTPVIGSVFDADSDSYSPINGALNSDRVKDFYQLDIRIDKRWVFDELMLNAYLDIQNVTNRQNTDGLSYNFDYTKTESSALLPIIPVIGLRGEF